MAVDDFLFNRHFVLSYRTEYFSGMAGGHRKKDTASSRPKLARLLGFKPNVRSLQVTERPALQGL
jgi:hypothetical protein